MGHVAGGRPRALVGLFAAACLAACSTGSNDSANDESNGRGQSTSSSTGTDGGSSSGTTGSSDAQVGAGSGNSNGNDNGPDGTPPDVAFTGQDAFMRADSLVLVSPNIITKPLGVQSVPAITGPVNDNIRGALTSDTVPDEAPDGYVDLSLIVDFMQGISTKDGGQATVGGAFCPYPYDASKVCGPLKLAPFQAPRPYSSGVDCTLDGTDKVAKGACFKTEKAPITLNVQLIGDVPLEDAQVIGSWVNGGKDGIANGWVRGFLSEETAKATKLPSDLPAAAKTLGINGNTPLIDFLRNNAAQLGGDETVVNDKGVRGWWFLVQYTAKPALFDPTVGPDGKK